MKATKPRQMSLFLWDPLGGWSWSLTKECLVLLLPRLDFLSEAGGVGALAWPLDCQRDFRESLSVILGSKRNEGHQIDQNY